MDDATMQIGLLVEAAQSHQTGVATALERLREHTAGLDAVVREELRATLVEELQGLTADVRQASRALQQLRRAVGLHALLVGTVVASLAATLPFALAWWLLPGPAELQSLRATRDELAGNIARLSERGARAQLQRCGSTRRLCVRIDRSAPVYGENGDYLVVKGY